MSRIDHSLLSHPRSSGVLLHPSSLPGKYGIGTLGPAAMEFIDFLSRSGQRLWQMLPVGPTGYGDSPYQGFSAFAGNPLLIALEPLVEAGLLADRDLADWPKTGGPSKVDFHSLIPWKNSLLGRAFDRFVRTAPASERAELDEFCRNQRSWITDYAQFMALKSLHGGIGWPDWGAEYRDRDPLALRRFASDHATEIEFHIFVQWVFYLQWRRLRLVASEAGISLIGDIPIFVSFDSADVWADRDGYQLDSDGEPTVVAGVPPDYFSETGQLWGNPIYRWEQHERSGFEWWQRVLVSRFSMYDHVRVDHFRGFCAYWAVPAGDDTAINGEWIPAPGDKLFGLLEKRLGKMPIIAENLGVITPDVVSLMEKFGFPGMKIFQFGFDTREQNDHLPDGYVRNSVVYTGTHDNNTVLGWFADASSSEQKSALDYLASDRSAIHWDFIRGALASVAHFAITPMQDILGLGSESRMNLPGSLGGNWQWRMAAPADTGVLARRLRELSELHARVP